MVVCRLEEGAPLTAEQIIEACAAALGSYKKPGQVELRGQAAAEDTGGKIDRKRLREAHWAHLDRRVAGN